jgi:hypothetical protein
MGNWILPCLVALICPAVWLVMRIDRAIGAYQLTRQRHRTAAIVRALPDLDRATAPPTSRGEGMP